MKEHNYRALFEYKGPLGDGPNGWKVQVQSPDPWHQFDYAMQGRPAGNGPFHVLRNNGRIWMSNTDAELVDMVEPIVQAKEMVQIMAPFHPGVSALVNGLGMGLTVAALLRSGVKAMDVVEIDGELIDWQKDWLLELATDEDAELTFHEGDALTFPWPRGSMWSIVWHDIWSVLSEDNRDEISRLHRRYGGRCLWQGTWGRLTLDRHRRQE